MVKLRSKDIIIALVALLLAAPSAVYSQTKKEIRAIERAQAEMQLRMGIENILNKKEFRFVAMGVTSSMTVASAGTRNGLTGYSVTVNKDSLRVILPYYGSSKVATLTGGGYDFKTTDFSYSLEPKNNGDGWNVEIVAPKVQGSDHVEMLLDINSSGGVVLGINSVTKDFSNFSGYIESL